MAVQELYLGSLGPFLYDPTLQRPDGTGVQGLACTSAPSDGSDVVRKDDIGGGGIGAPSSAAYVVMALDGDLSAERRLQVGTGLDLVDGGANGDVTINLDLTEIINADGANRVLTSDGDGTLTAEANVSVDSDGILYADAAPVGIDILYSGVIGAHLTVGNDLTVGGKAGFGTATPLSIVNSVCTPSNDLRNRGFLSELYGNPDYWKGLTIASADGTEASPTLLGVTEQVGTLMFVGYDGTKWRMPAAIAVECVAVTNNVSMAAQIEFWTGTVTGDASTGAVTGIAQRMTIDKVGNVGIGVSSFNSYENLTVLGTDHCFIMVEAPTDKNAGMRVYENGAMKFSFQWFSDHNACGVYMNGAERLTLRDNGMMGIGETSPDKLLTLADEGDAGSKTFSSNWAGTGWNLDYVDSAYKLVLDNMMIRGSLMVHELIINRIHAVDGSMIISAGRGKVASVSGASGSETIYMENPEGNAYHTFAVNDLIIAQRVDVDSTTVVKQLVRRVTSINTSGAPPDTLIYYGLTNDAGALPTTGAIAMGDTFVVIGNTTVTARQNSIYMSAVDGDNPFIQIMADVDSWADWTDVNKIRGLFGNLANKYGYGADDIFGFAAGSLTGPNVTIDPTNGIRFRAAEVDLAVLTGTTFTMYSGPASGKRIIIGTDTYPDPDYTNALVFYKDATTEVLRIDDNIWGDSPGIKLIGSYPVVYLYEDDTQYTRHFPGRSDYWSTDEYTILNIDVNVDGLVHLHAIDIEAVNIGTGDAYAIRVTRGLVDFGGGFGTVLMAPNGVVGTPAYTFADDLDTGIYRNATGQVAMVDDGTEVAHFDNTWGIYLKVLQTTSESANMYCGGVNNPIKRVTSGLKYKESIRSIEIDTSKIYDLNPVSFISKVDLDKKGKPIDGFFGLIAEEVHETLPNLCGYNEKGEPDWVQYPLLPVLMLPEMKKLRDRILDLEGQVATLKQQIAIA